MLAREIAAWKRRISAAWDKVRIVEVKQAKIDREAMFVGEHYPFEIKIDVADLRPEDIGAELVVAKQIEYGQPVNVIETVPLERTAVEGTTVTYALDYRSGRSGSFDVALRIYPSNPHLPHRMDFAGGSADRKRKISATRLSREGAAPKGRRSARLRFLRFRCWKTGYFSITLLKRS